jgi:replicative DNA helicase
MTYDRKKQPVILPDFGKVPPQANDMEEAVLGAIMLEKDAIYNVIEFLRPESFYREAHQKIFSAAFELTKKSYPCDLYSISEYLRSNQELESVGGPVYITRLTSKVVSSANIEYHASIIHTKGVNKNFN